MGMFEGDNMSQNRLIKRAIARTISSNHLFWEAARWNYGEILYPSKFHSFVCQTISAFSFLLRSKTGRLLKELAF